MCDIMTSSNRKEVGNKNPLLFMNGGKYMEEKLKKIREEIEKAMQPLSIIVDEVKYEKESGYNFLKVTLDKVNGLDMDAIVEATNIINPIVDELNLIDEEYVLDISSKERGN